MRLQRAIPAENSITEGVIWRQLLIFFFPILFGTFFQQLYNTADAVIVGNYVSAYALAAVGGSTSVLINLLVNLLVGISSAATIVVAQAFGGQRYQDVHDTVHTAFAFAIFAGGVMMVLGLVFSPWALRAMDTPEEIIGDSITYLRVYFFGMIPSFLYNMGSAVLRAVGDTRRPLYFLIVACLTNIVLDLLFVIVFGLGVFGVAIATVISQFVAAGLVVFSLMRSGYPTQLIPKEMRVSAPVLKRLLRIGLPAGIQSDMYTISNILIQSAINSFGPNTVAAWTAFGKIDGFFWMVMSAYGVSVMTFVGQNFGAQQYTRIRKSVRICLGMSFGTAIFFSVTLCLLAMPLLMLFTQDAAVLEPGVVMILHMVPFYFTYVCVEIMAGAIRGVGSSVVPMVMTCFGVCVLRVLWVVFVMPQDWRLEKLLVSYPATWAITSLLFLIYYYSGAWLRRQIAKSGFPPEPRKTRGGAKPEQAAAPLNDE